MGHNISGLVMRRKVFKHIGGGLAAQPCFALAQGFVFMPLDDRNLGDIVGNGPEEYQPHFEYLSYRLIALLFSASRIGPLSYIETEYFGGGGEQGAAVFRGGVLVGEPQRGEIGPINDALAKIGARRRWWKDEFSSLGLDAHRSNESFRKKGIAL